MRNLRDNDRKDIATAKNEVRMALRDGIPRVYAAEGHPGKVPQLQDARARSATRGPLQGFLAPKVRRMPSMRYLSDWTLADGSLLLNFSDEVRGVFERNVQVSMPPSLRHIS